MRRILPALVLLCTAAAVPSLAARNANGAILAHASDSYQYSLDTRCDTPFVQDVDACDEVVTRTDRQDGAVVWLIAAFPDDSDPGVVVVYFGIELDTGCVAPDVWWLCGPPWSLEIPEAEWPAGSPAGDDNSVAFGSPVFDRWFPFYGFRATDSCGAGPGPYLCTSINHGGGYASFVDNSDPPLEDPIHYFGCVRWYQEGSADCPPAVPIHGACCFEDGSCRHLTAPDCETAGGSYQGDGTDCSPNPCPLPGVCCFPDMSCQPLSEPLCLEAGGTWYPGYADCDPNPCPPRGACCLEDGSCLLLDENACMMQGVYQGDGVPCDPNPCPVLQACCYENGWCGNLSPETCLDQNGTPQGDGTDCDPNPCPQPQACCFPGGACSFRTAPDCIELGGTPLGDGTDCHPNPCPQPPGVCCVGFACSFVTPEDCAAIGGFFLGRDRTCAPYNPCAMDAACCRGETCTIETPTECFATGGAWMGESCDANPCVQVRVDERSWGRIKTLYR